MSRIIRIIAWVEFGARDNETDEEARERCTDAIGQAEGVGAITTAIDEDQSED